MLRMNTRWMALALIAAAAVFSPARADNNCGGRPKVVPPFEPRVLVVGLTDDQRLVKFQECSPWRARDLGAVSGLTGADTMLVGIDYRAQDGLLYGVGNGGGVYTIDTSSGAATLVSQLTVALEGTSFGVDFNPAADRLRIVSDTGPNLRHNVVSGSTTLEDLDLNYTAGTPTTGVTGAAYTNNDIDPNTGTTLFDVDSMLDQVVVQSPPNNGSFVLTGKLTVDASPSVGFDISTRNRAFASLVVDDESGFYRVDLLTGAARLIGKTDRPLAMTRERRGGPASGGDRNAMLRSPLVPARQRSGAMEHPRQTDGRTRM